MIESNFSERLLHLTSLIVYPVRRADEGDDQILICGFVQKHFRMARRNNLIAFFFCDIDDQLIDLPLPKNFQMRIWFIQKDNRTGIRIHVRQYQQSLLQPPSAG